VAVEYVLDSSAVLSLLFEEPGHAYVESVLDTSAISAVNLSEVLAKLGRNGADPRQAVSIMDSLSLTVLDWTEEMASDASDLSVLGWKYGLSLGDRACLALARSIKVPALTADRAWKKLGLAEPQIILIRNL